MALTIGTGPARPRTNVSAVTADPSHFTRCQLQQRTLLSQAWNGYASWLSDNVVPLRALLAERRVGTVIGSVAIDYLGPLSFFDADRFVVDTAVAGWGRRLIQVESRFRADERDVAAVELLLRPVLIDEPVTLSAQPGLLPPDIARLLPPPNGALGDPGVHQRIATLPATATVGKNTTPFIVNNHLIEMADQWAFIELPGLVQASREALGLGADASSRTRRALTSPLRSFRAELHHPFYVLDEGWVDTTAFVVATGLVYVHELRSSSWPDPHAVVIEEL